MGLVLVVGPDTSYTPRYGTLDPGEDHTLLITTHEPDNPLQTITPGALAWSVPREDPDHLGEYNGGVISFTNSVFTFENLTNVAAHEMGHIAGLQHSNDEYSLMSPGVLSGKLTPTDIAGLEGVSRNCSL